MPIKKIGKKKFKSNSAQRSGHAKHKKAAFASGGCGKRGGSKMGGLSSSRSTPRRSLRRR